MNSSVCVLAMGAFLPPPSLTLSLSYPPPSLLLVFRWGLYIYQGPLQAPIVPLSKLTDRCPAPQCGREPKESGGRRQLAIAESNQTIKIWKHCRQASSPAPLHPLHSFCVPAARLLVVTSEWRSDVLTPCCCWYHCCLWDSTACREPQRVERSTGCPRVRLKVIFLN